MRYIILFTLIAFGTAATVPSNNLENDEMDSAVTTASPSIDLGSVEDYSMPDDEEVEEVMERIVETFSGIDSSKKTSLGVPNCALLNASLIEEIQSYRPSVDSIVQHIMNGSHSGKTYAALAKFVDTFGPRMTGTSALEDSIDWVMSAAVADQFDDVRTEDVMVPLWVRNSESATMIEPRIQQLNMLGLGTSIATPPEGITAEVLVVASFDELESMQNEIPGCIVVYNQPFESYGESVEYRVSGASRAAKYGAVAVLVRSVTDFSIASPHTGGLQYQEGVEKIPAASITVEDSQMMHRLTSAGTTVVVKLIMGAENLNLTLSRNTIIDHRGSEAPEDVVVISGHVDSWDVGAGAMDDAGGCFISYHANLALKELGLRSRRTVRTIWFTGEEQGLFGGYKYFEDHKNQSENYQLLLESDSGTFAPKGIGFTGSARATCIMQEILKLCAAINTTQLVVSSDGPDVSMWSTIGVPIGSLQVDGSKYFWYHHSEGDTLDVEDSDVLDRITALWTSVAFVVADISVDLQNV